MSLGNSPTRLQGIVIGLEYMSMNVEFQDGEHRAPVFQVADPNIISDFKLIGGS